MPARCKRCGQAMNGRACANCGWDDATVFEEVWGLPAPQDPVDPSPPAAPPTLIEPSPPSYQPAQQPAYFPPVPSPPPHMQYQAFSPGPGPMPGPSPKKSRTGIVIGAVIAVVVLAVGGFFVFGRGGDDSTATDDTRTERTDRTDPTDRTDNANDTVATATASSPAVEPITTGDPDPTHDYPLEVRTNFLDACEVNSPVSTCTCILEGVETVYSIEEFIALEQQFTTTNEFSAAFNTVVASCQG